VLEYYVRHVAPDLEAEQQRIATLRQSLEDMTIQSSPILRELPEGKRRKTHLQLRITAASSSASGLGSPATHSSKNSRNSDTAIRKRAKANGWTRDLSGVMWSRIVLRGG
jgi:hypothetical protein